MPIENEKTSKSINLSNLDRNKLYQTLNDKNKHFLKAVARDFNLTHMDINKLISLSCDIEMWNKGLLSDLWPTDISAESLTKQKKQKILNSVYKKYEQERRKIKTYSERSDQLELPLYNIELISDKSAILGKCPVASEKTRCCNLQTLDAVINCGFGCTYCTIAPFYNSNNVSFHSNLSQKLKELQLDPDKIYHIGTGQSSDSLMWGNRYQLLDDLFTFATENPNVILELKSKAKLPEYLSQRDIPQNVISTWTLNTAPVIENEEIGTASLELRIDSARRIAEKGNLTGFHFHPMVFYDGWEDDYKKIAEELISSFDPSNVALISIGTLTFIKPVIRQIRERKLPSSILKFQLTETAGKYSYPEDIKIKLFSTLYSFFKPWHGKTFFYLCMEPQSLWEPVFGFDYLNNEEFEKAMKNSYMKSINGNR